MLHSRLLKPLDYLRIKVVEKSRYDYMYPVMIGSGLTVLLFFYPGSVQICGSDSLVSLIVNILQILTGFYIASLAAVATFSKSDMDEPMKGVPPTLVVLEKQAEVTIQLSRRRFLCLMFGYLAFLSFLLYFIGGFANLFAPSLKGIIPESYTLVLKWFFVWFYLTVSSNLVVTTLLGLFYMCDKIHR